MPNKKFRVAVEALGYISLHSSENAVSSKEICRTLGLKLRYIEQIMQKLVRSGILKGVRGASGGYFIARDRRKINLAEVYSVIKQLSNAADEESESQFAGLTTDINEKLDKETLRILENISLEEIYNKARKISAGEDRNAKSDFII